MNKTLRSPLRWPGGKHYARNKIVPRLPAMTGTLLSPFMGGGSVEIAFARNGGKVVAADADLLLVAFWQELLCNATMLASTVEKHYWPMDKDRFKEAKDQLKKALLHPMGPSHLDAAAFFAVNRSSFSGATLSSGFSDKTGRFSKPHIERLADFRCPGLEVIHSTWDKLLTGSFVHNAQHIYLDPPYINKSNLYGLNGSLNKDFDHKALAAELRKHTNWTMSYNDCAEVRALYPEAEYNYETLKWLYGSRKDKQSSEVLITPKEAR